MDGMMEFIEWWILEECEIVEESLCDTPTRTHRITLNDDHKLRMEEFLGEFLMIEVEPLAFPTFFSTFIENILVECEKKLKSENHDFPESRDKK